MSETTEKLEDSLVAEIVKKDINFLSQQKRVGSVCTDSTDALGMARRLTNLSPREAALALWDQIEMGRGLLVLRKALKNLKGIDAKKERAIRKKLAERRDRLNIILLNQDF